MKRKGWHKFGAKRTTSAILHRRFDSKGECRYAEHLFAREQNGEIRDLQFQVSVQLRIEEVNGVKLAKPMVVNYRVDFRYFDDRLGEMVWDEFKGYETREWRQKRDLWAAGAGPGLLRVTKARQDNLVPYVHTEYRPAAPGDSR